MYNEDLLAQHKPELLTRETLEQADLILVMDKRLLTTRGKTLPKEKTFLLKEFFGLKGDIRDPWPDGKDEKTLLRYSKRAKEIRGVIGKNIDRLINVLDI
jgi:protein-tyrosine-phosphatase